MAIAEANILLLITTDITYMRGIALGVMDYAHRVRAWNVRQAAATPESMSACRAWGIGGIVAAMGPVIAPETLELARRSHLPVVNISGQYLPDQSPDFLAMAADHLIGRGFRNFAFFGHRIFGYSIRREEGFVSRLAGEGYSVHALHKDYVRQLSPSEQVQSGPDSVLTEFLRSLPKPAGVYCANDLRGDEIIKAARALSIRVPDDLAVIGTDDDELLCRLTVPPLTSIRLPLERIGYEAARLLDRLMSGETDAPHEVRLPPIGVIERASTDSVAVSDPLVSQAMEVIRKRSSQPASVQQVADALAISRRALERRIRKSIGQTPHALLRRRQIEQAKQLLVTTDLAMPEIAARSGFSSNSWMSVVFKQEVGMTPTQYRRRYSSG
jgi:LacI family transcriptional regulator